MILSINQSISEYNNPIFLVPKKPLPGSKDKRWRLVVDFRQLNKKISADKFPLPRIDEILDKMGGSKFFSVLIFVVGFSSNRLAHEFQGFHEFYDRFCYIQA